MEMETNLRPLRLGEILDRTVELYRRNFLLFAGIFAVTNGIVLVLILLFEGLSSQYRAALETGMKFHPAPVLIFLVIVGLLGVLFYGASIAAITRAVGWVYVGEPAKIRSAYRTTLPRLGRYLWLMVLAGLVLLGVALLAALALGIILAIATAVIAVALKGSQQAAFVAFLIVGVCFDVGVFAIVAWFAARYALGIPACVVENLKARKALRRSVELSKESRGRIFMLFVLVGVIQIGLLLLTQTPFYLYIFRHHMELPLGLNILSQIISVATNTLVGPVLATGLTLFYFDQRVRKEGFDIEWMMQAAGMTQLPAGAGDAGTQAMVGGASTSEGVASETAAGSGSGETASHGAMSATEAGGKG
jgi:MFS family permease